MLTKQDLFLIKELIEGSLSPLKNDITGIKVDITEIKDELRLFKNDYETFKVEILNEIRVLRDEVSIVAAYRDDIEDHGLRISRLESNK